MKAASALLQSAGSMGLHLWVDGDQLRYKATHAVSEGMKARIREHRRDIITLLGSKAALPQWCNPDCPCLRRIEAAEIDTLGQSRCVRQRAGICPDVDYILKRQSVSLLESAS